MRVTIDARKQQCPIPVVRAKKGFQELAKGDTLLVMVDNEVAMQNLQKLAKQLNVKAVSEKCGEDYHVELIPEGKDSADPASGSAPADTRSQAKEESGFGEAQPKDKKTVVVISSNLMGNGNDQLGKVLMKGFIYALAGLDQLPQAILFYNGGVQLTCEGSDSLEDLKGLEAQGVEILSCGTCLDYYQLKEKLSVGTVTNMYTIVEKQAQADLIIRP